MVSRGWDPDSASNLSSQGPSSAGNASSQVECWELEEKGPLSAWPWQGEENNVIGGKTLLGFCSSEKIHKSERRLMRSLPVRLGCINDPSEDTIAKSFHSNYHANGRQ